MTTGRPRERLPLILRDHAGTGQCAPFAGYRRRRRPMPSPPSRGFPRTRQPGRALRETSRPSTDRTCRTDQPDACHRHWPRCHSRRSRQEDHQGDLLRAVHGRRHPRLCIARRRHPSRPAGQATVNDDGAFSWNTNTGKKTWIYYTFGGVTPNTVIVGVRQLRNAKGAPRVQARGAPVNQESPNGEHEPPYRITPLHPCMLCAVSASGRVVRETESRPILPP